MKLVLVEWEDIITNQGWHDEDDMEKFMTSEQYFIKSIGWLIKETKSYICIGSSIANNGDINRVERIPKGVIKKIKVIRSNVRNKK